MKPVKVMFLNPVASTDYDQFMADTQAAYKYPNTEAHVTS